MGSQSGRHARGAPGFPFCVPEPVVSSTSFDASLECSLGRPDCSLRHFVRRFARPSQRLVLVILWICLMHLIHCLPSSSP